VERGEFIRLDNVIAALGPAYRRLDYLYRWRFCGKIMPFCLDRFREPLHNAALKFPEVAPLAFTPSDRHSPAA
jgi:hypothetical protein